ncbi:37491_t:CDS:2 [Gigaspora margarita]|uniref:37491_t:CDS:1 n=1 Tax=Gigaspora margarita TaxID=4874 RepID=A0ABN7UTZ4_GIGMA|nr:37491_t:CDS:2 [Gigaspora margarita]
MWKDAVKDTKNNSVPGQSGITYLMLKRVGKKAKELLSELASECLKQVDQLIQVSTYKIFQ